jgi:hypothetical protein
MVSKIVEVLHENYRLMTENERLTTLNSRLTDKSNSYLVENARLAEANERLTAENAALRADIEITQARYHWCAFELFAHNYGSSATSKGWVAYGWRKSPRVFEVPTIDEAVDAARKRA